LLKVNISITENKSFNFIIEMPSIGSLIYLLKQEETFRDNNGIIHSFNYVYLEDLLKLAKFKFPYYDLKKSVRIINGSLYSSNIKIKL